jgi:hypothetical protein
MEEQSPPPQPEQQPTDSGEKRLSEAVEVVTAVAIAAAPALAVVADHLLNRPSEETPPPTIELPPGVDLDE